MTKMNTLFYLASFFIVILLIIGVSFSVDTHNTEKYKELGWPSCDHCMQTGKDLVAGTVFVSYPENSPGLGWVL